MTPTKGRGSGAGSATGHHSPVNTEPPRALPRPGRTVPARAPHSRERGTVRRRGGKREPLSEARERSARAPAAPAALPLPHPFAPYRSASGKRRSHIPPVLSETLPPAGGAGQKPGQIGERRGPPPMGSRHHTSPEAGRGRSAAIGRRLYPHERSPAPSASAGGGGPAPSGLLLCARGSALCPSFSSRNARRGGTGTLGTNLKQL